MDELDTAKAYIRRVGATKVAAQTKLARRTVQYITNSDDRTPNYQTVKAILAAMALDSHSAEKSSRRASQRPTELGK